MSWLGELRRRRVVPLAGVYLGACWVLLEFCNFVAERYHLSQAWVDALLVLAFALLPGMLLFAYNHGAPGRDRWTRAERVFLPLNLVLGLSAAWLAFGDRPLAAMAETVERVDAAGNTFTSTIARQDFRRRILLFPLRSASDDTAQATVGIGLSEMMQTGLRADGFVEADTILEENGVLGRLRRAGFKAGSDAPLALQRRIAEALNYDYLASGTVHGTPGQWSAELQLEPLDGPRASWSLQATTLSQLAEQMSQSVAVQLGRDIGAPPPGQAMALVEHYGSNDQLLLDYSAALALSVLENDSAAALARLEKVIAADPGFARAHLWMGLVAYLDGQRETTLASLGQALAHDYRLDDRTRFKARAIDYGIREQHDQRRAVLELWAELYPASVEARLVLAATVLWSGQDIETGIRLYREVLEMLPGLSWLHGQLANLYYIHGDAEAALAAARRYTEAEPESASAHIGLARLQLETGAVEAARASSERAALVQPELVGPHLLRAELEARQGEVEAFEAAMQRAEQAVREPRQSVDVHCRRAVLLSLQGRERAALASADQCIEIGREHTPQVVLVMDLMLPFSALRARVEGLPETLRWIEEAVQVFDQSFRDLASYGRVLAAIAGGDATGAQRELELLSELMRNANRTDLDFMISYARGCIASMQGDHDNAIVALEQAREAFEHSLHGGNGAERFFEMQVQSTLVALRAYLAAGRSGDAQPLLRKALGKWPGSPQLQTLHAQLALANGDLPGARQALQRAQALWVHADPALVPSGALNDIEQALSR